MISKKKKKKEGKRKKEKRKEKERIIFRLGHLLFWGKGNLRVLSR